MRNERQLSVESKNENKSATTKNNGTCVGPKNWRFFYKIDLYVDLSINKLLRSRKKFCMNRYTRVPQARRLCLGRRWRQNFEKMALVVFAPLPNPEFLLGKAVLERPGISTHDWIVHVWLSCASPIADWKSPKNVNT